MTAHRFKEGLTAGLCTAKFGGVLVCGLPREHSEHIWEAWEGDTSSLNIVAPEVFEAATEPVTEVLTPPWLGAHLRPPDEDAEARGLLGDPAVYSWGAAAPVAGRPAAKEGWEEAVECLESETLSLLSGPWPVRRFALADDGPTDVERYRGCLRALDALGSEYVVTVVRPHGRGWRWALVTWGSMLLLSLEEVCDELASEYGS